MDLSGRPLLDTKPDHALFANRHGELDQLLEDVRAGLNVLVIGERGSGKTSLLRQLAYELRNRFSEEPTPAFVEGRLANDVKTFLDLVRFRLGLRPTIVEPGAWQTALRSMGGKPVLADALELPNLISSLREATPDGRRVVLVDELPASSVGQTIFGRLRDELWQVPLTWVVSAAESEAGPYLSPPADAFFDTVMRLEPLTKAAQREVLQARAGKQGARIASQVDEGNLRRLLALTRELLQGRTKTPELLRAAGERDVILSKMGRSASMLMAELESLGAASASDETLLGRLGWTRSRAVQVFRQLEDEGLVVSSAVKGESGRPRKVYRSAELTESKGADR